MNTAYITGVGMLRFGKMPRRGIKSLTAEPVELALRDAGISARDLDAAWFANSAWGMNGGQDCIRGEVALRPMGIDSIPIINVENACAGGATALHCAWLAVTSRAYDVVLAVGAEKLFIEDRLKMFAGFIGGLDVEELPELIAQARRLQSEAPPRSTGAKRDTRTKRSNGRGSALKDIPRLVRNLLVIADRYQIDVGRIVREAGGGAKGAIELGKLASGFTKRSPFMDVYAIAAREHMARYGSTQRQMAIITAKNRQHGADNPLAQVQKPITVDDVLVDREVAYPLTRAMCAPTGDGAAAVIVCSERAAKRLGLGRAVRIRASQVVSGKARGPEEPDIAVRASRRAYEQAGVGPSDISLAEVHDATAFGELHHTEALGFCAEGQGGALAESGATSIGGRIPINTGGGLEARGHPIAASGLAQAFELVSQLRGEAGARQVRGARLAIAQNGGGVLGVEEAAMGIHILEAPSS